MPSPFQRLLQRAQETAQSDPAAAFAQVDELYGKSLTDLDVRQLAAFAAHVGGTGLGRFDEAMAFCERCLEHPGLEAEGDTEASIQRAIAVLARCLGDEERAAAAIAAGVRTPVERCRIEVLTAQALVARSRLLQAVEHLRQAGELMAEVPLDDELRVQAAAIANHVTRAAEKRLLAARECAVAASDLLGASLADGTWQDRHKALYHRAKALMLAARPAESLAIIQDMMRIEHRENAGAEARFHTASLACRAQLVRGQLRIAAAALRAAAGLADDVPPDRRRPLIGILDDLGNQLERARDAVEEPTGSRS